MKKLSLFTLCMAVLSLAFFSSCKKAPTLPEDYLGNDAWVLNEGSWGGNNSSLCALQTKEGRTVEEHAFLKQNGRGLGDIAQDMIAFNGEKLFIAVSESNTIEVVDITTGKSIHQIDMGDRYPRYLCTDGEKIYVSCYTPHSVVKIDAESHEIEATCELSGCLQPEQLCYLGGKIYVCSSWQSTTSGGYEYDNKVAVIDCQPFTLSKTIEVGTNPMRIKPARDNKSLVVSYAGDYASNLAGCALINTQSEAVTQLPVALSNFDIDARGNIIGYATTYDENWTPITEFYSIDPATLTSTQILTGAKLSNPYAIHLNPDNTRILVCDGPYQSNGDVYCFDRTGNQLWKADAGIFPNKIVWMPNLETEKR